MQKAKNAFELMSLSECCVAILKFIQQITLYLNGIFEQMWLSECCVAILKFIQQIILFIPKKAKSAFMQMSLSKCCVTILNFIQQITLFMNKKGQKCINANVIEQMLCRHSQLYPTNNPLCEDVHYDGNVASKFLTKHRRYRSIMLLNGIESILMKS